MTKLTAKNWKKEFELKGFKNKLMGILIEWFGSEAKYQKEWAERIVKIHKEVLQTVVKDFTKKIKKNITSSEFSYIDGYGQMRLNIPKFLSFIEEVLERGKLWK